MSKSLLEIISKFSKPSEFNSQCKKKKNPQKTPTNETEQNKPDLLCTLAAENWKENL